MQDRALPVGHTDFRADALKIRPLCRRVRLARTVPFTPEAWAPTAQLSNYYALTEGLYLSPVARDN